MLIRPLEGFSKLPKQKKLDFIVDQYFSSSPETKKKLQGFWHEDDKEQRIFDEFSENTITNFYFPFGVVPNMLINGKTYCVPMVIEESSVVAAAGKSGKYWFSRGGFTAEVVGTKKIGQIHFFWYGEPDKMFSFFKNIKEQLLQETSCLQEKMQARGGGLQELSLIDKTEKEPGYYQLLAKFETCNAMGANFINTLLEALSKSFQEKVSTSFFFTPTQKQVTMVMSILSNYTPDCLARSYVECPVEQLAHPKLVTDPLQFVDKFAKAIKISQIDTYRAVTHNKGIFNGIDAVAIATGNDFRALEAAGHAYACRFGQYQGLTYVEIKEGIFKYGIEIPLCVGTVGGLTNLHPLARLSLDMLGHPSAKELMMIIATMGLAQNFAAICSLITTGIQKGHMKMHLLNILNHLEATPKEQTLAKQYFKDKVITHTEVGDFLAGIRNYQ